MASSRRINYATNRGGFLTAYIHGEPHGEMNPKFVREVFNELKDIIVLVDRSNRSLKVQFNKSKEHPMFVAGWSEVGPFFGFEESKLILMTYVGKNRFILDFLPEPFDPNSLPTWHSYKYSHNEPISFEVELTNYLATGSQLTLKKNFADYVRATKFKTVILIGPLGDEIECKLLIKTTKMKKSVKIGEGWMEFVERNGFNKGDILNFKFINKQEHNLVNVFQYQP
ncbi:DNA helicase [Trifolium repens]|nr:DNA helicase [Trifolium repens]